MHSSEPLQYACNAIQLGNGFVAACRRLRAYDPDSSECELRRARRYVSVARGHLAAACLDAAGEEQRRHGRVSARVATLLLSLSR